MGAVVVQSPLLVIDDAIGTVVVRSLLGGGGQGRGCWGKLNVAEGCQ